MVCVNQNEHFVDKFQSVLRATTKWFCVAKYNHHDERLEVYMKDTKYWRTSQVHNYQGEPKFP